MYREFAGILLAAAMVMAGCSRSAPVVPASSPTLTIEEHAVVERSVDQPGRFEFKDRISKAVLEERAQWRNRPSPRRLPALEEANAALAPFGYKLVAQSGTTVLQKGDAVVLSGISEWGRVALGSDGKDFALVVYSSQGEALVRPGGMQPWSLPEHLFQGPVFAGNDLVEVKVADPEMKEYIVLRKGREVYRGALPPVVADSPLKGLHAWDGKWVVEVKGDVVMEGKSQKSAFGYDEVFGWQLLDGEPFFFFRKDGKFGLSHSGGDQGVRYDDVVHYMCCEPAMFNPVGNGSMVWFYARKGEMWHYVEAGIYR